MWTQREIVLEPAAARLSPRHGEVVGALPELGDLRVGLLHLLLQHTCASLTLNENASPDVRRDLRPGSTRAVPEELRWTHTLEGADDMPAHVKASLTGPVLTLPVAGRAPRARHLAGDLPLRAPRPRRRRAACVATLSGRGLAALPDRVALLREGDRALARVLGARSTGPVISPWRCQKSSSAQSALPREDLLRRRDARAGRSRDPAGELERDVDRLAGSATRLTSPSS